MSFNAADLPALLSVPSNVGGLTRPGESSVRLSPPVGRRSPNIRPEDHPGAWRVGLVVSLEACLDCGFVDFVNRPGLLGNSGESR